jgi:membrane fusion protein (multidrug efflux system)
MPIAARAIHALAEESMSPPHDRRDALPPARSGPPAGGGAAGFVPATRHASGRRAAAVAALAAWAAALLVAGCGRDQPATAAAGGGAGAGGAAPPPPAVGVVEVSLGSVPLATELPGRVEAARTAQVRARVTGIVQQQLFREGSDVKAGQPLFRIDPAPYQAVLASAQAALAKAQANQRQAAALVTRYRPLREANAISEQEFVNAQAGQAQAEADVAAARAAIQTAQLNLGYATVTAPIGGRVGRALVSVGALVSQTEATQLALVQQTDPVFVNSTQSVAELRRLRQALASGRATAPASVPVRIVLDDGTELPRPGRLLFSDVSVDATSGQVSLRAEVPNPDLQLLPGQYVRVRLAQAQLQQAILLPQQAVTRSAQGDTVLVVGADNKPAPRPVRVGGSQQGQWVVLDGLQAGERVVVEGFQKLRPGQPVNPVPWTPVAAPAGASAPAPGSAPPPASASASATSTPPAASR